MEDADAGGGVELADEGEAFDELDGAELGFGGGGGGFEEFQGDSVPTAFAYFDIPAGLQVQCVVAPKLHISM